VTVPVGDTVLGQTSDAPFTAQWLHPPAGDHELRAVAHTMRGEEAETMTLSVSVDTTCE
jgi:hypothetical protein